MVMTPRLMIGKWVLSLDTPWDPNGSYEKLLEEFGRRTRLPHTATIFGTRCYSNYFGPAFSDYFKTDKST